MDQEKVLEALLLSVAGIENRLRELTDSLNKKLEVISDQLDNVEDATQAAFRTGYFDNE